MRPGKAAGAAVLLIVFGVAAVMFVKIIWFPLYGDREAREYAAAQEQPAIEAEIVREDGAASRSWSVKDREALSQLRQGMQKAEPASASGSRSDQKYLLRLRRADSHIDEYEIRLDERGDDHDVVTVVRRDGGGSVTGGVFRTPELRRALRQAIAEPRPAAK